jgi:hypothetical protein
VPYNVVAAVPVPGTGTVVVGAGRCGPTLTLTMPVPGTPEPSVKVPCVGNVICGTSCGSGGGKLHTCAVGTGTVVVGAGRWAPPQT